MQRCTWVGRHTRGKSGEGEWERELHWHGRVGRGLGERAKSNTVQVAGSADILQGQNLLGDTACETGPQ